MSAGRSKNDGIYIPFLRIASKVNAEKSNRSSVSSALLLESVQGIQMGIW